MFKSLQIPFPMSPPPQFPHDCPDTVGTGGTTGMGVGGGETGDGVVGNDGAIRMDVGDALTRDIDGDGVSGSGVVDGVTGAMVEFGASGRGLAAGDGRDGLGKRSLSDAPPPLLTPMTIDTTITTKINKTNAQTKCCFPPHGA